MVLVEMLLPLKDNSGTPFPTQLYRELQEALAERFGGVTAYMRSPANGLWNDGVGGSRHDDVVLFEIMAETLEAPYWQTLKGKLADDFRQNDIVVRVTEITRL
ncbi:hypothetical protein B5V01_29235 [Mesorhizobium erdmanii]|uniref:DUF1330 domain-containing protein n=2 Tax=Mesorhizobium TaxID=68287 RepID=A0A3M9X118_9HYPH|nr:MULTISPECIES: hypothetical protein [Mesorhizobium]RNJ41545.1 hypothetical protein DNR46_33420 [Mesorhizobium japonicum]RXT37491.1 hypothetical protein B5V01_29235 [Mesorhizobium erdmanii]